MECIMMNDESPELIEAGDRAVPDSPATIVEPEESACRAIRPRVRLRIRETILVKNLETETMDI